MLVLCYSITTLWSDSVELTHLKFLQIKLMMLYYSKFYFVHNTLRNSTFYQYYTLSILPILHIIQLKHKWTTTF